MSICTKMKKLLADDVARLFTGADGSYAFARWDRPLVPVVFGVDDESLGLIKGATEAVAALAGLPMEETDPEIGANLMLFFIADWRELAGVPEIAGMVPEMPARIDRLVAEGARQYRVFRFDESGAIRACFAFVRLEAPLTGAEAEAVALSQAVGACLTWSERAFAAQGPLARLPDGRVVLRPEIAAVIAAAYDPVMPVRSDDASHALRLAARLALAAEGEAGGAG